MVAHTCSHIRTFFCGTEIVCLTRQKPLIRLAGPLQWVNMYIHVWTCISRGQYQCSGANTRVGRTHGFAPTSLMLIDDINGKCISVSGFLIANKVFLIIARPQFSIKQRHPKILTPRICGRRGDPVCAPCPCVQPVCVFNLVCIFPRGIPIWNPFSVSGQTHRGQTHGSAPTYPMVLCKKNK